MQYFCYNLYRKGWFFFFFLGFPFTITRDLRDIYRNTSTISWPPLDCGQQSAGANPEGSTGQKKDKEHEHPVHDECILE